MMLQVISDRLHRLVSCTKLYGQSTLTPCVLCRPPRRFRHKPNDKRLSVPVAYVFILSSCNMDPQHVTKTGA